MGACPLNVADYCSIIRGWLEAYIKEHPLENPAEEWEQYFLEQLVFLAYGIEFIVPEEPSKPTLSIPEQVKAQIKTFAKDVGELRKFQHALAEICYEKVGEKTKEIQALCYYQTNQSSASTLHNSATLLALKYSGQSLIKEHIKLNTIAVNLRQLKLWALLFTIFGTGSPLLTIFTNKDGISQLAPFFTAIKAESFIRLEFNISHWNLIKQEEYTLLGSYFRKAKTLYVGQPSNTELLYPFASLAVDRAAQFVQSLQQCAPERLTLGETLGIASWLCRENHIQWFAQLLNLAKVKMVRVEIGIQWTSEQCKSYFIHILQPKKKEYRIEPRDYDRPKTIIATKHENGNLAVLSLLGKKKQDLCDWGRKSLRS